MTDTARLLGFAFANADFLFEIDKTCTILFASGAASEFVEGGADRVIGGPAQQLFRTPDTTTFGAAAKVLAPGKRTCLRLTLLNGKKADVSMFRLPDNGDRISCTLSMPDCHASFVTEAKDLATGLVTRDSFLAEAMKKATENDALTLVGLPALPSLCAKLPADQADALLAAIGKSLMSSGAKFVGRLSETSFGTVSDALRSPKSYVARIRALFAERGLPQTKVEETLVSMKGREMTVEQRLMAVRYVVERFTSGDHLRDCHGDLGQVFSTMMDETEKRVRTLTDTVANRDFEIVYQPIKELKTGILSHFEALSRFRPGETAETIQFAEALGIANAFDLTVALKVIAELESDKSHSASVAFNVSGHTIQSPSSFALLAGFLTRKRKLAPRLLIEVTETAQITDLQSAAKAIDALRALGYRVGLDDFGAGAATLNYLHAFNVDFVKFDGALVKKLGASKRDDMLLGAMLKLCDELCVTTIAECLENEADIVRARDAGFHYGQGFVLGSPGKIPPGSGAKEPNNLGKRKGIQEFWG